MHVLQIPLYISLRLEQECKFLLTIKEEKENRQVTRQSLGVTAKMTKVDKGGGGVKNFQIL